MGDSNKLAIFVTVCRLVQYQKLSPDNAPVFVDGIDAPIRLKHHSRARRIILRINERTREVNLTVPEYSSEQDALDFLARNKSWVMERLRRLPQCTSFLDGEEVPLRGDLHKIFHVERNVSRAVVEICCAVDEGELPRLYVSGKHTNAPRRLKDWLKRQARNDLVARVEYHAKRLQLTPKKISIRDQKSRWGSCSSTGTLSFSWRLVLAPPHVLDYVAAHEVAHLQEMNHGPKFWKLVERTLPDYRRCQEWLKEYGSRLHRYGEVS